MESANKEHATSINNELILSTCVTVTRTCHCFKVSISEMLFYR